MDDIIPNPIPTSPIDPSTFTPDVILVPASQMIWVSLHPKANEDHLGFIPSFLNRHNPASAQDQIASTYVSGWNPFQGFVMEDPSIVFKDNQPDPDEKISFATLAAKITLNYPNDPPTRPLWISRLRDEVIIVYVHSWVAIVQKDGSFTVARLD